MLREALSSIHHSSFRVQSFGESVEVARGFQGAQQPVGPSRAVGRMLVRRARELEPGAVDLARLLCVNVYVAVPVACFGLADANGLVPAVHPRNGVGVNRESQVLVDANVGPPDARGVGVGRLVTGRAALAPERPLAAVM